ncbi:hypothetical protein BGI14_00100, partial [Snodgrassella alvi]
ASPIVSYQIGQYFKGKDAEGSTAHLVAHAVVGAAVAAAGGNNALAGGLAAAGTEALAPVVSKWLYGKESKDLTADEKATVSSIIGLAGAVTGAAVGGSMADVAQGNQAGHTAVDNNELAWKLTQKVQEKEIIDFFYKNLGNKVKLQPKLDKDGNPIKTSDGYEILELVLLGDIKQLSDKEKLVYKTLKDIIDDTANIAKVTIDKNVPMVNTGDYQNQIIDLEDVLEYDKIPYGISGIAAIMHELYEQYEKSKHGTAIGSIGNWDKSKWKPENDPKSDFSMDHSAAVDLQNQIDNTERAQGSFKDKNSGKSFDMLYVDKTNNQVIGVVEEKKGNQYISRETVILPDSNGYYDINATIQGQTGPMRFRLKNGQMLR